MSIVSLKKVTLYFDADEKAVILQQLQNIGCAHLNSLQQTRQAYAQRALPTEVEEIKKAIKYLRATPHKRRLLLRSKDFDVNDILSKALKNKYDIRAIEDRIEFLIKRIKDVSVWGDFTFPESDNLDDLKFWFYQIPHRLISKIDPNLILQEVGRDHQYTYIIVISHEEPPVTVMPVPRIHIGAISLHLLQEEKGKFEIILEDLQDERRFLTKYLFLLEQHIAGFEDKVAFDLAMSESLDLDQISVVQGWMPEHKIEQLSELKKDFTVSYSVEDPSSDDTPPTLLKNPPSMKGAEYLLGFYQTPSYWSADPTKTIFFSFSLFFAMIMADAGYGLILLFPILWKWKAMGRSAIMKALRPLFLSLSIGTIIFGTLVGSFFGISPPKDSLLGTLKILDLNDFNTMMGVSIFIGCLHIAYANILQINALKNWQDRIKHMGWVSVICGGAMFGVSQSILVSQTLQTTGIVLLIAGLTNILLFGSTIPVTNLQTALQRFVGGLLSLTRLSSIFGDILSYLRLFALGLAGSSLSLTFNNLAGQAYNNIEGGGLLLAILILLLGHILNFALCLMSAVVHGLRLNFIEFLNWGVSEEGTPYKPFQKQEIIL